MKGLVFYSRVFGLVFGLAWLGGLGCDKEEITREVGARCTGKSDCSELCMVGDSFPGGFCTTSCFSNGDCSGQSQCVRLTELGVCMFSCEAVEDCAFMGEGWECLSGLGQGDGEPINVCMGAVIEP